MNVQLSAAPKHPAVLGGYPVHPIMMYTREERHTCRAMDVHSQLGAVPLLDRNPRVYPYLPIAT